MQENLKSFQIHARSAQGTIHLLLSRNYLISNCCAAGFLIARRTALLPQDCSCPGLPDRGKALFREIFLSDIPAQAEPLKQCPSEGKVFFRIESAAFSDPFLRKSQLPQRPHHFPALSYFYRSFQASSSYCFPTFGLHPPLLSCFSPIHGFVRSVLRIPRSRGRSLLDHRHRKPEEQV